MLPPVSYLVATLQSRYVSGLKKISHLHVHAGPCLFRRDHLYLTATVQVVQTVRLSGRGIAQHRSRLQPHMYAVKRSAVVPPIALLQQVLPRNYSSASGTMVKHLPEGQGLETTSSKSLV